MHHFAQLSQRLFNTPLMILPSKAEVIMASLSERLGITAITRAGGSDFVWMDDEGAVSNGRSDRGFDTVENVAVIEVRGTLVQRTGTLRPYSGMTGYDGIRQNLLEALADPKIDAIVLDVDSPGGEVAGCFDLADTIYRARAIKPIWSILGENAFSAAYALASAAEFITVPRTGGTGSIGVIVMHVSLQEALKQQGIEVTLITKGALKGEGSEVLNLSEDAYARIKADVDEVGDLFDRTVARNRGLTRKKVYDTEAGTYLGAAGVDYGLADAVMAPDEAFRALLDYLDQ
ncbi:S49 family peptidase [Novosphingobium sp. FSW06-99]|uniref:S49 family peptidase n=1 Tax=Novosphingobium sp. FSW06-99 TaxID=1739113 RepID=UPI00076C556D|nr:S49 family peptidase [Novosphingobium sp. FSW06-99]KUR80765.1 serine peptidase [Novosphingobium sp. FSW06-99]